MSKEKEKITTETKGTQVAPKVTPVEKEAAKKASEDKTPSNKEPAGAPAPREILEKGKPAEEGAPVKAGTDVESESDLNRQNSDEASSDPAQNRQDNNTYGKGL